jgi:hypothetical protein
MAVRAMSESERIGTEAAQTGGAYIDLATAGASADNSATSS